jgi:hypothetical protein
MQPEGLRMRYKPFGTIYPSSGEFDAGRSEIYIPDQIVTPPAERHKKRKKAYESRASPAAQQDSDPMEVELSQARSESRIVSPEIRPSQHSPSKQALTEKGSERLEEKKKKRKKKHKDREASST